MDVTDMPRVRPRRHCYNQQGSLGHILWQSSYKSFPGVYGQVYHINCGAVASTYSQEYKQRMSCLEHCRLEPSVKMCDVQQQFTGALCQPPVYICEQEVLLQGDTPLQLRNNMYTVQGYTFFFTLIGTCMWKFGCGLVYYCH